MSEKFSSTVRISDINDFIAPSQGCIVSLKGLKAIPTKQETVEKQVKVAAPRQPLDTEIVKISLKDCLACSGCITSAETVMLEKQSLDEFLSSIKSGKAVIVSLSPQSRASLASHFGLSPSQVFKKLTTFLKSLGVKAVFDTSCSRDLSLIEACNEFISRYNQSHSADGEASKTSLPMITSACPGWICYAEKTLGSYILPYISSVKSPQQTMGATIKHHICQKMGFTPDNIYHVTVMPCYDKKLEAARDDFLFPMEPEGKTSDESEYLQIAEVDSVLTSGEILDLLQLKSVDFNSLEESPLDRLLTNVDEEGNLYGVSGGSGGYAQTIFRNAAKQLFGRDIEGPLEFKVIRNVDFQEVNLEVDGKTVLKFALCYGFRNLQNIVRKIKIGKCDYHFLEVMACPSGCLNGGGQIKPKVGQSGKDLIQSLETIYMEEVSAHSGNDDKAGSEALLPVEGEFKASGVVANYTQARKQAIRDLFARGFDEHGKKLLAGNYDTYGFSVTVPTEFVAKHLEPAFIITNCLQTGVRLEGYNISSIPAAASQRDIPSDGSSLDNANNSPVVATEPYRFNCKRKRQAFGVYTDRDDNGGAVPKTTGTKQADGFMPLRETFDLPNEINREGDCSNETQALLSLKQEDYLVLPCEFSPPVVAAGEVGSASVMKLDPLFFAGVYVLNKRVVGNDENAVKFGLARLMAVKFGWYDKQREVRFEPIPATAFDDMVADAEMIKKHMGVAKHVAWIVPLCAEHTFRTQGPQFLSNLNAAGCSANYAWLFKSCLVPEIDKFLPGGLMFHTAFHWISPRRVWEVLIANKDKDVIPEAIRLRASAAPAGAAIISISRAVIDAMKPMALIAALEEHVVVDLECIEAVDKKIGADPVKYHKVPSAYGLGPLPEEDLRVFEHAKREAEKFAPVTKAFVDIMLSRSPMAEKKVLNEASNANPGLHQLVRKHLIEYLKATPTSLSQVFANVQIKKITKC